MRVCGGDCNDANPNVKPGAPENCFNGVDDDCDELVDAADPACSSTCPDADHDGYRDRACDTGPSGNDCADADATTYPGAPEACDSKNNDCNDPAWPALPNGEKDGDGDGVRTCADNCPTVVNASQADRDHDLLGDACDACSSDPLNNADGDSLCGNSDVCPFVADPLQRDTDRDGVGDACDTCATAANVGEPDVDRDGRQGPCDPDNDGDGTPDTSDPDADNDGVPNGADNCPLAPNPSKRDEDADTRGDACDGEDRLAGYLVVRSKGTNGAAWPWLQWDKERGALSYDVYRLELQGTPPANAGDCYHRQVVTLYTPLVENPAKGGAYGYLVAPRTAAGAGLLGRSSNGAARSPGTACP